MTIFSQDDGIFAKIRNTVGFVLVMIPVTALGLAIWLGATFLVVMGPTLLIDSIFLFLKPLAQGLKFLYP